MIPPSSDGGGRATPGPWKAHRYIGNEDNWFVRGSNNEPVCGRGSGPVVEANARLIAAAPELFEAAAQALEYLIPHAGDPAAAEIIDGLSSALAAARGQ